MTTPAKVSIKPAVQPAGVVPTPAAAEVATPAEKRKKKRKNKKQNVATAPPEVVPVVVGTTPVAPVCHKR
jgi:hypothetical protein